MPSSGKDNSSFNVFSNVRKHSSKILPNFNYQMYDQGQGNEAKPSCRHIASSSSAILNSKSVDLASSACLGSLEAERIANPKAYETMFAVPTSSKFGGLKKRSQVMSCVSGMQADDKNMSNVETLKVGGNLSKISTFQ